ncbi:MAG: hypothetical protein H8E81_03655 [Deltaproteobacteria bacterium]|nr:hypothetical protein [Deltaproteobacteria bacterium]
MNRNRGGGNDLKLIDFVVGRRIYRGSIENKSDDRVTISTMGRFFVGESISLAFGSSHLTKRKRVGKIVDVIPDGIKVQFNPTAS